MREIKFRGKRLDNGEWVYGNLHIGKHINDGQYFISSETTFASIEDNPLWQLGHYYRVDPDSVGEYVQKENFYEGDVLRGSDRNENGIEEISWIAVAKFDESAGRIRIMEDNGDWYETDDFNYEKIIGNIYDNPNLFDESKKDSIL